MSGRSVLFSRPGIPILGAIKSASIVRVESSFFAGVDNRIINDLQRIVRTGIQPGNTAPHSFDHQLAALQVAAIEIGDFQFPAL